MTYYSVAEIADAFGTNQETIRRWIRDDKLKAETGSLREGKKISEASLQAFLESHPKYASVAAKSPILGFKASVSLGKTVIERSLKDIGKLKVDEMEDWITEAMTTIAQKEEEIRKLKEDIAVLEAMQKVLDKMKNGGSENDG